MFDYHKNWLEFWFFVLMIFGLGIALVAPSAVISYIMIFLAGFFCGRLIYGKKGGIVFPFFVVIVGFLAGYVIGVYYGSRIVTALLFIAGYASGYWVYSRKILKDIRF